MKYTEVPTDELVLSLNAGAAAMLIPNNAVNLTHMRELIIEVERRAKLMHSKLQEIKAETTKPLEEAKKSLEVAAEVGRVALREDIKRNGETVKGIALVIGQPMPELPLVGSAAYERLTGYLLKECPAAVKTTIDSVKFKAWFIAHREDAELDMATLGVEITEPAHVRFS